MNKHGKKSLSSKMHSKREGFYVDGGLFIYFYLCQCSLLLYYLLYKLNCFADFVSVLVSNWSQITWALKGQQASRYNPFVITVTHVPFSVLEFSSMLLWADPWSHPKHTSWFVNQSSEYWLARTYPNYRRSHYQDSSDAIQRIISNTWATKIASFRGMKTATRSPA